MLTLRLSTVLLFLLISPSVFSQCNPDLAPCEQIRNELKKYEGTMGGKGAQLEGNLLICESCAALKSAHCSAELVKNETERKNVEYLIEAAYNRMDQGSLQGATIECDIAGTKPKWGWPN